jgi:RNA polymerase sigma-70 factor (ECF subfamily)
VNQTDHWCERVYDAKAAELILYGRALGLSHGEAEDVVQETFLAMMQAETAPVQPENYVVRSFRNRALNYRRTLWRRLTREWEAFADTHHWFEKSPEQSGEERALQEATVRALAELPLEQREVIVLKIWHDRTFEEIGGLLEISPNTAAGRYRYGLQKLKTKLNGVAYERTGREPFAELAAAPGVGGVAA